MFLIVNYVYILQTLFQGFKGHQEVQNWNILGIAPGRLNQEQSSIFNI